MLIGQQLGPFLIEKELGAGAMGAVYRGKYLKTGALVAIKVMAPGLGQSNPNAVARFEREAAILKQLKHPNIVRYYGSGKYQGTPFYAMEYIQGESMDRTIARRDRMSWEQVVELGKQLCSALQHAHDAGIVHRDLKPSNLMLLADGTVKLTDFGIAKDLDVTQLTAANCAIGTAAYMSPEQCKGDPNLTAKSDLYSLGVVFYELLTGRKPFVADNAMEMFMQHVTGKFERPSKLVPELPMWLDTLVCQLLEKKPEHRPVNAAMVGEVLATIQEKAEAQASVGLDIARARRGEAPSEKADLSSEDRIAARSLLGQKSRKKKKKAEQSASRLPLFLQAGGLIALLATVAGVLYVVFQPPSPQVLHDKAEALVQAGKLEEAYEGPIADYLMRYGKQDTPLTKTIREWADQHRVARLQGFMDKHIRHQREGKGLAVDGNEREKQAYKAGLAEYDGDLSTARATWSDLREGSDAVAATAKHHLRLLEDISREDARMAQLRSATRDRRGEIDLDPLTREAFTAWRQENLGDLAGAARRYEKLRDEARGDGSPKARYWALYAAGRMRALREKLKLSPQEEKARVQTILSVAQQATEALSRSDTSLLALRVIFHEIVYLYESEPPQAEAVQLARAGIRFVDERVK
jgi:serine/threonine-protein kinase